MSNALYSILPAVAAVLSSAILFLRIKKNNIMAAKNFFWHYAFAFGVIALSNLPIFLINLRTEMSYNDLLLIYGLTIFAIFVSYLLFFRGTVLLFTRDRFFLTVLPLLILPAASAFSLIALFFMDFPTILIYTAISWGFLFVNDNILGSIFLYSFATGSPIKSMKRKSCALILALGWFAILGLDVILWINAALYHPDFWILKIASSNGWFLARAVVYLVIMIGVLRCNRCFNCPEAEEK